LRVPTKARKRYRPYIPCLSPSSRDLFNLSPDARNLTVQLGIGDGCPSAPATVAVGTRVNLATLARPCNREMDQDGAQSPQIFDGGDSKFEFAFAVRKMTAFRMFIASALLSSSSCFRGSLVVTEFSCFYHESPNQISSAGGFFPNYLPALRRRA
jgi:hypothetical protein